MKDLYEFDSLYKCHCDSHFLRITQFNDDHLVSFSKLSVYSTHLTFLKRVTLALGYIFNPEKYDIHDDLIFDFKTVAKISKDLSYLIKCNRGE